MNVTVAKTAGFCFGVRRAVDMVEKAAAEKEKAVTLGPIIHNSHVVERFEKMGVRAVDGPDDVQPDTTVIIRSHGVAKSVYTALENKRVNIIDATCPFVKRIHKIVSEAEQEGRRPIIIGTRTHPEIVAIAGW